MRWEERLLLEFDDLEQQAEGLHLAERDAVVAELSVSEYAEVELAWRLHASVGSTVRLTLAGGAALDGVLVRAGRDWVLLGLDRTETLVATDAMVGVRGCSERAVPPQGRSALARLGLGSALRQLAAARDQVAVRTVDGRVTRGWVRRVGADFVEVAEEGGQVELVALHALVLVRRG